MTTILDAALEMVRTFGPAAPKFTILVTTYVDGAFVLDAGNQRYILVSEWVLDQMRREFAPPPDNVLGLSALSGIPVITDEKLAADLLVRNMRLAAS